MFSSGVAKFFFFNHRPLSYHGKLIRSKENTSKVKEYLAISLS